jgi:hypothetical protein
MIIRKFLLLAVLATSGSLLQSQPLIKPENAKARTSLPGLPAYKPTREEMLIRYKQAGIMDSVVRNKVFKMNIQANWQADGESFWYRNVLKDTVQEYYYVDALHANKQKAFDHVKLAKALTEAAGKTYHALHLSISNMYFGSNGQQVLLQVSSPGTINR